MCVCPAVRACECVRLCVRARYSNFWPRKSTHVDSFRFLLFAYLFVSLQSRPLRGFARPNNWLRQLITRLNIAFRGLWDCKKKERALSIFAIDLFLRFPRTTSHPLVRSLGLLLMYICAAAGCECHVTWNSNTFGRVHSQTLYY
jgi:hypothetical protein